MGESFCKRFNQERDSRKTQFSAGHSSSNRNAECTLRYYIREQFQTRALTTCGTASETRSWIEAYVEPMTRVRRALTETIGFQKFQTVYSPYLSLFAKRTLQHFVVSHSDGFASGCRRNELYGVRNLTTSAEKTKNAARKLSGAVDHAMRLRVFFFIRLQPH